MKKTYILLIIIVLIKANTKAELINQKDIIEKTDKFFKAYTDLDQFNGVVLLAKQGNIIFKQYYNMTDSIPDLHINSDKDKFLIASVSKLFTKLAIYKLEDTGKLSTSDALQKYFPTFPQGEKITIEMLMNHSSGISRQSGAPLFEEISMKSIIDSIMAQKLEFEPGTKEKYSNAAYIMLAGIIEKISGKKFEDYMQKNIYIPLGMKNTGMFHLNTKIKNLKGGYIIDKKGFSKLKEVLVNSYGCGGEYSTAYDLLAFSKALSNKKLVDPEILSKMRDGKNNISWIGGNVGYRSYFNKYFNEDFTVIILSNYHMTPLNSIIKNYKTLLHGEKYKLPKVINRKAIDLNENIIKKYVGVYPLDIDPKMKFEFKLENGKFYFIQLLNNDKSELHAESENKFFYDFDSEDTIIFELDETGEYKMTLTVQGMKLSGKKSIID